MSQPPILGVTYTRYPPATDWSALGRPSLPGAPPVVPPGSGQTITQQRDATLVLGAYRPGPTTAGVDPSITLQTVTNHVPVSGQTYRNLRVQNNVNPGSTVSDVRYENCLFEGPNVRPAGASSLYTMFRPHQRSFTFVDCTFLPQLPDYRWNGIQGYGFTMRRCDISRLVDALEVFNSNAGVWTDGVTPLTDAPCDVIVEQCYFHDHAYFPYGVPSTDPRWGGGEAKGPEGSHSDGIQWQGGTGLVVRGNYFTGMLAPEFQPNYAGLNNANAAMQIKPDAGRIAGANIEKNWFGGGAVTINVADAPAKNRVITAFGKLTNNRFYRTQQYQPTNIILTASTSQNPGGIGGDFVTGNVRDDDSSPVSISYKVQT